MLLRHLRLVCLLRCIRLSAAQRQVAVFAMICHAYWLAVTCPRKHAAADMTCFLSFRPDFPSQLGTIDIVLRHKPDDLNTGDAEGATPLHLASSLGRSEIVKFLLAQGGIVRRISTQSEKS